MTTELEAELEHLSSTLEETGAALRDAIKEEKQRKEAGLQVNAYCTDRSAECERRSRSSLAHADILFAPMRSHCPLWPPGHTNVPNGSITHVLISFIKNLFFHSFFGFDLTCFIIFIKHECFACSEADGGGGGGSALL